MDVLLLALVDAHADGDDAAVGKLLQLASTPDDLTKLLSALNGD